jgi:hypothetical protein
VGDINVLHPLQTVVPACGQVQFCGSRSVDNARPSGSSYRPTSVGDVLLVVRNGKFERRVLDNLSYSTAPLRAGRVRGTDRTRVVDQAAFDEIPCGETVFDDDEEVLDEAAFRLEEGDRHGLDTTHSPGGGGASTDMDVESEVGLI